MGYDKKVADLARAELENRRLRAEGEAQARLEAFHAQCPQALELKHQLASRAAGIARAVMGGGNVRAHLKKLEEESLAISGEYDRLLAGAGLSRRDVTPQYTCPQCRDTGFVDGKMCGCYKQLRRSIAYRQLSENLPLDKSTFASFSLDYYQEDPQALRQMTQVLNTCRSYAQRFRANSSSLLFRGATGLGKTHLSLAIANEAIEKGFGVVYGSAQGFAVALEKERFDREDSGTGEKLKTCDLLILDDLGTEFASGYVNAALYDILNTRMLGDRPTIVSTNLGFKELEDRYSPRFASRIVGYYGMLEFKGQDVRVQRQLNQSARKGGSPTP